MKFYMLASEAPVLRHALMSYRNRLTERNADKPPSMADGFERVTADLLIERLDMMSERLLRRDEKVDENS